MLRLRVLPTEGAPYERLISGDTAVIGRAIACDISIPDLFLSREHARLRFGEGRWWLEDLGSQNGTEVNGRRVTTAVPVAPGDEVRLAGYRLQVLPPEGSLTTGPDGTGGTLYRSASEVLEERPDEHAGEPELRRFTNRLRLLNEIHKAVAAPLDRASLIELVLERTFAHLQPEEGVLFLKNAEGDLEIAAARPTTASAGAFVSSSLTREVAERGLAALVLDVATDERFAGAASMLLSGVRSLVAAPLLDAEGSLGMIVLSSRLKVRQFNEADMETLVSLASVAALALRNLALAEEAAERRRLEEELALARRIQVALLPSCLPDAPGWQVHCGNVPSRFVSGDYYLIQPRKDGTELAVMLADVSGKGMAASLLTATLEALAAEPIEDGRPPDEVCTRLSRQLYRRTPPEKYATAVFAVVDIASGQVCYTNAGHLPALVIRTDGSIDELGASGVPLGLLPDAVYPCEVVQLAPGDTLVVYSDGLTEVHDVRGDEFGVERFAAICARDPRLPLENLAQEIEADLERFVDGEPFPDDRTLVLVRRTA